MKDAHAIVANRIRMHGKKQLNRFETFYYLSHKRFEYETLCEWGRVRHKFI